jgi:hypothetical protein
MLRGAPGSADKKPPGLPGGFFSMQSSVVSVAESA